MNKERKAFNSSNKGWHVDKKRVQVIQRNRKGEIKNKDKA